MKIQTYCVYAYIYIELAYWVECSPMAWEIGVQSQFMSYKKRENSM